MQTKLKSQKQRIHLFDCGFEMKKNGEKNEKSHDYN